MPSRSWSQPCQQGGGHAVQQAGNRIAQAAVLPHGQVYVPARWPHQSCERSHALVQRGCRGAAQVVHLQGVSTGCQQSEGKLEAQARL